MADSDGGALAVSWRVRTHHEHEVVAADWDFGVQGGSFGAADATAFLAAIAEAVRRRVPLVTTLRSGGTRLTEGMSALVGIPRAVLALQELRRAGLTHIAVADTPTTGGIWVAVGSVADIRIGTSGAVVAFSGPRVAEAMTGRPVAPGSATAEAAYAAGLLDVVVDAADVDGVVGDVLAALSPDTPASHGSVTAGTAVTPARDGWAQVSASRDATRPDGLALIDSLLAGPVALRGGDATVAAAIGRCGGRRVAAVALSATRSTMPTPAGFDLLSRTARLASDFGLPLVVFVDTPGADPHTEAGGLAPAIARAMTAVLDCAAPTLSLVHGEGGSGGALAGAVTDVVGISELGWFAALGPEGAAAALRRSPEQVTELMRVTPADLLAQGFADEPVPAGGEAAWLDAALDRLSQERSTDRLARRRRRWSSPLRPPP